MFSIHKFYSRTGRIGQPLDYPYPIFEAENIRHRYGATSMIAGKPGSFKSLLALNMLSRWMRSGYSAVFFSADSDERTVASRLASITTGVPWTQVDADFERRDYGNYLEALEEFHHVRFEFRALEMEQITDRLNTFETMHGGYPDLVFIDNLINFAPSTDDWGYMRDMTNGFDQLARETKSHFVVLHHASRSQGAASDPVPAAWIQGKIDQIPRLVLTTAAYEQSILVSCVKNTNGPQYPDAQHWTQFDVQDNLRILDNYEEL